MTLYLAYDTETTGHVSKNSPSGHSSQPDMVQLACILFDEKKVWNSFSVHVQPTKPIDEGAYNAHHISKEDTDLVGVSRRSAIAMFSQLVKPAELIIAHNVAFDWTVICTAFVREQVGIDSFMNKPRYCTMESATDICKLPKPEKHKNFPGTYKWPSLQEAYKIMVDEKGFDGAHDALVDVQACIEVFKKLKGF